MILDISSNFKNNKNFLLKSGYSGVQKNIVQFKYNNFWAENQVPNNNNINTILSLIVQVYERSVKYDIINNIVVHAK